MKNKSRTEASKPDAASTDHAAAYADVIKAQLADIEHARKHRELQTALLEIIAEQFNKPAVWVDSGFEVDEYVGHSAACLALGDVDYCLPSCPIAVAFVAAGSPETKPSGNGLVINVATTSFSSNMTSRKS